MPGFIIDDELFADHVRMRRESNATNTDSNNDDESFSKNLAFYCVAGAMGFLFIVVLLASVICGACCKKGEKVSPNSGGAGGASGDDHDPTRARNNWGRVAGRMRGGGLKNNSSLFANQNHRKSRPAQDWDDEPADVDPRGPPPAYQAGAMAGGWPSSKFNQGSMQRQNQFRNQNGRLAQMNAQLREDADVDQTHDSSSKPGQVQFRDDVPGDANTPSGVLLSENPHQPQQPPQQQRPPVWKADNFRNKLQTHDTSAYDQPSGYPGSKQDHGGSAPPKQSTWKSILFDL